MAYTLKDQNGNFFNINGCRKGTINYAYKFHGGLFTNNTGSTTQRAFYSTYRRVLIDGVATTISSSSVYNSTAYDATSIGISGRYSSSSYKAYEVYLDGTLVASGDYTSTATTIYTYTKTTATNIRIDGSYTDSKFVYNITTNPELPRTTSYQWDNGTVKTRTISIQCESVFSSTAPYGRVITPSYSELVTQLGVDESMILSSSYSFKFEASNTHTGTGSGTYTYYFRTEPTNTTSIITTLPGSSLGSIGPLSYNQSSSFTRTGSSYLGKIYYLFYHSASWSSNQYRCMTSNSYDGIKCTLTWTVSYVSITQTTSYTQNIARTNAYTMPKITIQNCIDYIKAAKGYGDYGTLTIHSFSYTAKKLNSSSTTYYYQEYVNGQVIVGPDNLVTQSSVSYTANYTEDMPTTRTLKRSTSSTGSYSNGSDSTIHYTTADGDNYITISYTWEP